MSTWNRYRSFEDFENAELWSSEIVDGALQVLDGWEKGDGAVNFEGDLDDDDDDDDDLDDEDFTGDPHDGPAWPLRQSPEG